VQHTDILVLAPDVSLMLIDCSCSFGSSMASIHHIFANLHLCWVQKDEDLENPDERHHADSDMEMDDVKPMEDSERCSFFIWYLNHAVDYL
jgi:hypothetical protein